VIKPSTYNGGLEIVKYFGSFLGSTQLAPWLTVPRKYQFRPVPL
jgi:hypothetical protein